MNIDKVLEWSSVSVGMLTSYAVAKLEMTHMLEVFVYGFVAAGGSYLGTQLFKAAWNKVTNKVTNKKQDE